MKIIAKKILPDYKQHWKPSVSCKKNTSSENSIDIKLSKID